MNIEETIANPLVTALFQNLPYGILLVNSEGSIIYGNSFMQNLFGWEVAELVGKKESVYLPDIRNSQEVNGLHRDGGSIPVAVQSLPFTIESTPYQMHIISDLREKKNLDEEKALFKSILEQSTNGVIIVNKEGQITFTNHAICELFGYAKEELVGNTVETLVPNDLKERHSNHRKNYMLHPKARKMAARQNLFGLHKSGKKIPVEICLIPVMIKGQQHVVATLHDITERKAQEQKALDSEKKELTLKNEARSENLQMIAHDLRAPLASIIQSLSFVRKEEFGALTDEQKEIIGIAEREANLLLGFIADLLDASILNTHELKLTKGMHDINHLIKNTVNAFKPLIKKKNLEFITKTLNYERLIYIDPKKIIQIINNLLSNAIKYTDQGSISLELTEKNESIVIVIRDTGRGISKERQDQLFKKMEMVDHGRIDSHGLGLFIAKHLAQLHNGSLTLESEEGKGTTFTLKLPTSSEQ